MWEVGDKRKDVGNGRCEMRYVYCIKRRMEIDCWCIMGGEQCRVCSGWFVVGWREIGGVKWLVDDAWCVVGGER